jgi:hypothetical protein
VGIPCTAGGEVVVASPADVTAMPTLSTPPSAAPTAAGPPTYCVDLHGHDLSIGHLTSVHACGVAIGELDLRLPDREDRVGTVASQALATARGTETTSTIVGGPATCVAALEHARGDALRPHAAQAAPCAGPAPHSLAQVALVGPARLPAPAARGRLGHGPPTLSTLHACAPDPRRRALLC